MRHGLRQWTRATGVSQQEEVGFGGFTFYIDSPWLGTPTPGLCHLYSELAKPRLLEE